MQLLTIFKIIAAIGTLWQAGQDSQLTSQEELAKQASKQEEKEPSYENSINQAPQLFIYPDLSQVPEEVLSGTPSAE